MREVGREGASEGGEGGREERVEDLRRWEVGEREGGREGRGRERGERKGGRFRE